MSTVSSDFRAHYCMHLEKSAISLSTKIAVPTKALFMGLTNEGRRYNPHFCGVPVMIPTGHDRTWTLGSLHLIPVGGR